jgi:hypothetical protein
LDPAASADPVSSAHQSLVPPSPSVQPRSSYTASNAVKTDEKTVATDDADDTRSQ